MEEKDIYVQQVGTHIRLLRLDMEDCENSIEENLRMINLLERENNLKLERINLDSKAVALAEEQRDKYLQTL